MRVAAAPAHAIKPGKTDAGVNQTDVVHQVMQRDVGIASAQARQNRLGQARESRNWIVAESRKQQVEPHHVRLDVVDGLQQSCRIGNGIETPAAHDVVVRQLLGSAVQFVRQDREAQQWIALQFTRNMESVFVKPSSAGRKRAYQANLQMNSPA